MVLASSPLTGHTAIADFSVTCPFSVNPKTLKSQFFVLTEVVVAGASILIESMYKIRQLSKRMLEDKLRESVHVSDMDAKRDIMSILVRARKAEREGKTESYAMNDQAMMDQVVC